jgi:hypothetical protein
MSSDFFYISNNSFLLDLIIMYSGNDQSTKIRMMLLKFDGYAGLSIATLTEHQEFSTLFTKKHDQ